MSYSLTFDEDEYRKMSRPAVTSEAKADQWLNWGDVTVQVDPIASKQWILDGSDGHERSAKRGKAFDLADVRELIGWENRSHPDDTHSTLFRPSVALLDSLPQYSAPVSVGCKTWRGAERDPRRFGQLPSVSSLLRDRNLAEKSVGEIEAEQRDYERGRSARLFDKSGFCR